MDYTKLHDLLVAGKWKEADEETSKLIDEVADDITQIPCLGLIIFVPTPADATAIREVLFGKETADKLQNRTIIQMGTIAPDESRSIQEEVEKHGGQYLEAPVLGSIPQAKEGTLLVILGSKMPYFEPYKPILQQFSSKPQHIGEVGTASALKLALNQLIASLTSGFA